LLAITGTALTLERMKHNVEIANDNQDVIQNCDEAHMKNRVVTTDNAARWVAGGVEVSVCGSKFALGQAASGSIFSAILSGPIQGQRGEAGPPCRARMIPSQASE
jgi:hypothetical protein